MNLLRAYFSFLSLIALTALPANSRANDVEVTKTGDSVVDAEALTIYGGQHSAINGQAFQQDALKTFQGYQYVTWYDRKRQVCRVLPASVYEGF